MKHHKLPIKFSHILGYTIYPNILPYSVFIFVSFFTFKQKVHKQSKFTCKEKIIGTQSLCENLGQ